MSHLLISIVAPEGLEFSITADLKEVGVHAWTAWTVRGAGAHGSRPSQWSGANVRIDLVAEQALADKVLEMLAKKHPRSKAVFVVSTVAQVHG